MPSHAVVSPSDTNFEVGGNKEGMAKGEQEQEVETREQPRESCACRRTLLAPLENQEEDLDEEAVWNAVWEPEVYGTPEARIPRWSRSCTSAVHTPT